jgi:hypothetical protein
MKPYSPFLLAHTMEALITQFEALKTQFLAFEASLKNTIPPTAPDPNNIIDRRSVIDIAKETARATIQARTEERVTQLRSYLSDFNDNRTDLKRLLNSEFKGPWHSPAKQQLRLIEQEIRRIEAERTAKRRQNRQQKLRTAVAEIGLANPEMTTSDIYRAAYKRLRQRQMKPPTKFQAACAEVRKAHPTMPDDEIYFAARMRLKVKACLPGLAALNN